MHASLRDKEEMSDLCTHLSSSNVNLCIVCTLRTVSSVCSVDSSTCALSRKIRIQSWQMALYTQNF